MTFLVVMSVATLQADVASACRVGGDFVLSDARPINIPAGLDILQVDFTNFGPEFEKWERADRTRDGLTLIGVARPAWIGDYFPVYHAVTSCTHGFYGRREPIRERTFLVGKFTNTDGKTRAFHASGNWNGRWTPVR